MSVTATPPAGQLDWPESNKQYLVTALGAVRTALSEHCDRANTDPRLTDETDHAAELGRIAQTMQYEPAIETVVRLFRLSPFERDVLLLCAGVELESDFASLCGFAHGDPHRNYPTFSLALAALPEPHWSALSPGASLRHWNLVHPEPGGPLTGQRLVIDERVLHYLMGIQHLDVSLSERVQRIPVAGELVASHDQIARSVSHTLHLAVDRSEPPFVQLCGDDLASKRAIAEFACRSIGATIYRMSVAGLPTDWKELESLRRTWQRESAFSRSILMLDCDAIDHDDRLRDLIIARFIEDSDEPIILSTRSRRGPWQRPVITFDVEKPTTSEQRELWQAALGEVADDLGDELDRILFQFNLTQPLISAAGAAARLALPDTGLDTRDSVDPMASALWNLCRQQARPQLDELAERIETAARWDELVIPESEKSLLKELTTHVRHRALVYQRWGFRSRGSRGLGISALFAGPSGTGKTMAAEVLANELSLDLYRIDLSAVVSKYIGETEKNLRHVFDAAEAGGAILLFDEADALFGKRSDVKDSHDRHANIEVSYLLQRMESYGGLAILTTNLKDTLDPAFLRRIRFVVSFPFPDQSQRGEIWRHAFPADLPTEDLDLDKLARLNLAGGNIRNVAVNAAFLAAQSGDPLSMQHIAQAARREYDKLERTLTSAEVRDW